MKLEINLKDLVTYLLIITLLFLYMMLWQKVDILTVKNQVATNTQTNLNIINHLNQQQADQQRSGQPQITLVEPPQKKEGK